jgi:wobble nucleotide-excising tRNase
VQQAMGMISDFGEALNTFEVDRKNSTFKALSQNDILKIQMLRRQYERHWQSVNDLLLVADPKLLDDFKRAKKEQEEARQRHLAMLARKKKARDSPHQPTFSRRNHAPYWWSNSGWGHSVNH